MVAATIVPPKGAPNILLIMTDDAGYGVPSTFGGVIPTPAIGPHREGGIAVHAVSLHRALLAHACGANHGPQSSLVGFGVIGEMSTGFPGYDSCH